MIGTPARSTQIRRARTVKIARNRPMAAAIPVSR